MEKTAKMTKAAAFTLAVQALEASSLPNKDEAIAKVLKEIENLQKKNSKGAGAPTKKQVANMGLGDQVVQYLAAHPSQMFTIGELMKNVPDLPEDISNQKMTSLFRLESVKPYYRREMIKGKAYFQYTEPVDTEEEEEG